MPPGPSGCRVPRPRSAASDGPGHALCNTVTEGVIVGDAGLYGVDHVDANHAVMAGSARPFRPVARWFQRGVPDAQFHAARRGDHGGACSAPVPEVVGTDQRR